MKRILAALALALALPAAAQPAPNSTAATAPPLAARMDKLARFYTDSGHFMGTVLVAKGDQILLDKGYGYANLEWKIANTPQTKFRLGSITKQFTAASILILEERGKIAISDPVKKYLPDMPASWDKITIQQVMAHTAGIPNYTEFPDIQKTIGLPTTPAELIASFKDKPLDFEPGTNWHYSNSGYVLLGYLVEKISGEPYAKFVAENIFTPLQMKDSGYDSNSQVIARRAAGYQLGNDGMQNASYIDMTIPYAAGGLYSTTGDLLLWERALFGGKLLSSGSLAKMTTVIRNNFALGLEVRNVNGHREVSHDGGISGFSTQLTYYPDEQIAVIALGNLQDPAPELLANKLSALMRGEKPVLPSERKRIALTAAQVARFAGHYKLNPATVADVTTEQGHTFLKMGNQPKAEIFPVRQNRFFTAVPDAEVEFTGPADAPATQLVLYQGESTTPASRMSDAEIQRAAQTLAARRSGGTQDPRSEAALRKNIANVLAGTPDDDSMSPGLANATRQNLAHLKEVLGGLGPLQSVTFTEVGPGGMDFYKVQFEKGTTTWHILMGDDGKIVTLGFKPG